VIHRTVLVPALLAASLTLGACSTVNDSQSASRVGDATLGIDELEELLVAATPGATAEEPVDVAGDTARAVISNWVLTRILEDEVAAAGGEITEADRTAATEQLAQSSEGWDATPAVLQELQIAQQAAITVWSGIEEPAPSEEELRAIYEQGIEASDIACTAHILVETEAEALDILAELEDGADFATLAAERSLDTASGQSGGSLPCSTANSFAQQYVPEFVEAAFAAEVGVPVGPVETDFGFHVIRLRPFDEVGDDVAALHTDLGARFRRAARTADVYVDPRYGAFDPVAGVVPLG
jgi:hypothetical protein